MGKYLTALSFKLSFGDIVGRDDYISSTGIPIRYDSAMVKCSRAHSLKILSTRNEYVDM